MKESDNNRKVYSSLHLTLYRNDEAKALIAVVNGFIPFEEQKINHIHILKEIREHGLRGFISDSTEAGPVSPEMVTWITEVQFPQLFDAGIRTFVNIVARNTITRFGMEKILNVIDSKAQLFDAGDIASALEILKGLEENS
ncbi:MAG: hypothetical protein CVV44_10665 [Spirochaetae bacterium HGW-Spirochaetae-1]|jgi:hypothetical protein|nr:MAG: hypothetical protein CVV44_10665 [Spirochaetae bacterium HGW-Spirochaetae-1]